MPIIVAVTTLLSALFLGLRNPVIALGAFAFAFFLTVAEAAWLFGIWLAVVMGFGLIRYPYLLAEAAAQGVTESPPVGVEDFNPVTARQYWMHAALLVLLGWLLWGRLGLGPGPTLVIMALVAPPTVGIISVTGSLLSALNPIGVLSLVMTLGASYLVLALWVIALVLLAALAQDVINIPLLSRFLGIFALMAAFDASGRVLHVHRHEVPFVTSTAPDRRERSDRRYEQHEWDEELDRIYRAVRGGDSAYGLGAMQGLLAGDAHRLESYELLYERVREWQLPQVTVPFARSFIERLVQAGQVQRAMEVTEDCLRQDSTFRPAPALGAVIAAHARSVGHESTAELLHVPGASDLPPR